MTDNQPLASLLTPSGRGAIAVVRVEGPAAASIVARLFCPAGKPNLADAPLGRILFGHWRLPTPTGGPAGSPSVGEEVIVCRRGDQAVEVHCHGGTIASGAILDSLAAAGCRVVPWRQWLDAAQPDPTRAAALTALAEARTQRTAAILLDQAAGALARAVRQVRAALVRGDLAAAHERLACLTARAPLGQRLLDPFRIVLAGPPNAGKSSLVNALLGYQRAIVFDRPGTTRDAVTASTALDGWPVLLTDTAGLHAPSDPLEAAGVERASVAMAAADCLLLVFDVAAPCDAEARTLRRCHPAALLVWNKCDLLGPGAKPLRTAWSPTDALVSALSGAGLDDLIGRVASLLVPAPPQPGEAVPFTAQQAAALAGALDAARQADCRAALAALQAPCFSAT